MKKKQEKKFSIISSEWSKTSVSIVEANQSQQIVILRFNENFILSEFALCKCKLSPLLNTPEIVTSFFFDLPSFDVHKDEKVYIVFSDTEESSSRDDENNLVLFLKPESPFDVKDDEVVGLLQKSSDNNYRLLDWEKVIIDEPIPLSAIDQLSTLKHTSLDDKFYKKNQRSSFNNSIKNKFTNRPRFYDKIIFWLLIFWITLSIFEIFSLVNFYENIGIFLSKTIILLCKNIFIGFLVYFIFKKEKSSLKNILIFLSFSLLSMYYSYIFFATNIIIGTLILLFFSLFFTLFLRSKK